MPHLPDGFMEVVPQFPTDWSEAAIESPMISYTWIRTPSLVKIDRKTPREVEIRFRIPVRAMQISEVVVYDERTSYTADRQDGICWVSFKADAGHGGSATVLFVESKRKPKARASSPRASAEVAIVPWKPPTAPGDRSPSGPVRSASRMLFTKRAYRSPRQRYRLRLDGGDSIA